MLESIKNIWQTLNAVGFFPAVTLTAFGLYFILIQWLKMDKRKAAPWPMIVSFIGQLSLAWPQDRPVVGIVPDVVNIIYMGIAQAVAAVGIYSFADKYGLMDKLGGILGKKLDSVDTPK